MSSFSEFLKRTRLPVYLSHEKGQAMMLRKGGTWDEYGFSCDVSTREWDDFPGQVKDAIRFLKDHSTELETLGTQHKVEDIRLDFPIESRLSQEVFAQCDYLPTELVRLCARHGIGIELSQYAPGENGDEDTGPKGRPRGKGGRENR